MKKLRKQNKIFIIIMILLVNMLMMNLSLVFASTNENETMSYYDRLIHILNNNEVLTDKEYHDVLSKAYKENPYFLVSLNDQEIDALEKIYHKIFSDTLTMHINKNDVSLTFFGIALLADLESLLKGIPVDLYVNATFSINQSQLDTIEDYQESHQDKEVVDLFHVECKQVINNVETRIQETSIPIRMLRYNIQLKDYRSNIQAYAIKINSLEKLGMVVYSDSVVQIKTNTLDTFGLIGNQKEKPISDNQAWYVDFTIDNNRLLLSGALILGVGGLISYLMIVALKTKKQVEA